MCWELTVLSSNMYNVRFQFSDVPQDVKDKRGDYYALSLGYHIQSCVRPEIVLESHQIFVWGENKNYDNDELIVTIESFRTLVHVLSINSKVIIKGVNKICIGGC